MRGTKESTGAENITSENVSTTSFVCIFLNKGNGATCVAHIQQEAASSSLGGRRVFHLYNPIFSELFLCTKASLLLADFLRGR